jgi:glutaredoxin
MNNKTLIIGIVLTLVLIIGGVFLFSSSDAKRAKATPLPLPTTIEYYSRIGCPHCENVDAFISTWAKKDSVQITDFETGSNNTNAERLIQRSVSCNIPSTEVGVPMFFTPEGKCIVGDTPIIDYLKTL